MKKLVAAIALFLSFNVLACFETVDVKLQNLLEIKKFTINHRLNFQGAKSALQIKEITDQQGNNVTKSFIIGSDKLFRVDDSSIAQGTYDLVLLDGNTKYQLRINLDKSSVGSQTKTRGAAPSGCGGPLDISVVPSK